MIIPKQHLGGFVSDLISSSQLQPSGIDVTLCEAHEFAAPGKIDFDNSERKISESRKLDFVNGEILLMPGSYKVMFNEYVKIPSDTAAVCLPRSSLLRCGVSLHCALWDPGYEGRSEALLVVYNPHGIVLKKNAKIGQLVFIKLAEEAASIYEGRYNKENKNLKKG